MPDGSFSSDLVLSSTSDRLFVANPLLDSISVFDVAADGTLSAVAGSPFATQASGPTALAVDPLGRYLFSVSNGSDEISSFAIDTLTGALSGEQRQPLGGDGVSCATLFSANGTLTVQVAAASPNRLVPFTVDTADGSLTALTPEVLSAAPTKLRAVTNGLDRLVYVCTNLEVERYALNDQGQPFRPLPITPYVVPAPSDIAFVADGSFAFVTLAGANELSSANVLEGTTGQLSAIQPFPAPTDRTRVRNDPRAIALGSGGQPVERVTSFVYAANTNDGDVGQFEFNPAGPGLTSLLPAQVVAGVQPNDVVVHPFIEAAYVIDAVAGTMADIFSFNIASNGQLSTTGTYDLEDAVVSGDGANALAIEPSGRFAYVVRSASPNSEIIRYAIDPGSGILTPGAAVDAGGSAQFPAIDPTGRFLYVPNRFTGDVSQFAIDPVTGALSNLGTIAAGASPSAAAVDATGRFAYVANRGSNDVSAYQIDPVSGTLSSVGPAIAAGTGPAALAVGPRGRTLYVANELAGTISRFVANLNPVDGVADGSLISVGPFNVPGGPRWLDFDAEGSRMFVSLVTTGEVLTLSVALNGSTTLTLQDSDISAATTGT
ncbi:MAG: beta-propeller fold lactonase family protein, partial [Planctomycetota bacterium]